jgi:hypothetical protein
VKRFATGVEQRNVMAENDYDTKHNYSANPLTRLAQPQFGENGVRTRRLSIIERNEAKNFALEVVRSEEYRNSVWSRAKTGTLPPQVEIELWNRAYGKCPDKLEVTGAAHAELAGLTTEQLAERAQLVSELLRQQAEAEQDAEPSSKTSPSSTAVA